jgi:glucose/mannose transport system substrate-binding protein
VLASIALDLPPCVSVAAAAPDLPQGASPLVLFHWWSSPSEMAALDALSGVVKARYPDFAEKRTAAPPDRGAGLFAILQSLAKAGKAPNLVTMNTGYNMKPFVDANLLARLDDLWISERLESVIPPSLQAANAFDGHYYSAPLGVHRTNLIWYNKRLLDKHGIDPGSLTTQERFFDAAKSLRAAGVSAPIQMAATATTVQVFEGLMASQGIAVYGDWVNGRIRSASDPRLLQALGTLKQYVGFANRDSAGLDWLVALRRVAAGQSAFYWTGDWANADFRAAGLVYGKDYGVIVAPGTNGLYGVSIDAFVKPLGSAAPQNANRWLKVATSREGQDAFNAQKGSIPARRDPNLARYDAYQRWAIASFKQSKPYPIVGAALPASYVRTLSAVLEAFIADGDVRRAAAALAAATADSAFTRVWSPD